MHRSHVIGERTSPSLPRRLHELLDLGLDSAPQAGRPKASCCLESQLRTQSRRLGSLLCRVWQLAVNICLCRVHTHWHEFRLYTMPVLVEIPSIVPLRFRRTHPRRHYDRDRYLHPSTPVANVRARIVCCTTSPPFCIDVFGRYPMLVVPVQYSFAHEKLLRPVLKPLLLTNLVCHDLPFEHRLSECRQKIRLPAQLQLIMLKA